VAVLVDRSDGTLDFGVPTRSLIRMEVETFAPDRLPADLVALPAVKPGSK
jgi:orotate phosphoribosyltransferase